MGLTFLVTVTLIWLGSMGEGPVSRTWTLVTEECTGASMGRFHSLLFTLRVRGVLRSEQCDGTETEIYHITITSKIFIKVISTFMKVFWNHFITSKPEAKAGLLSFDKISFYAMLCSVTLWFWFPAVICGQLAQLGQARQYKTFSHYIYIIIRLFFFPSHLLNNSQTVSLVTLISFIIPTLNWDCEYHF